MNFPGDSQKHTIKDITNKLKTMDYKKEAEDLVNQHRIVLMDSGTDAGEEILCTSLAKKHAEITVNALVLASYDLKEIQRLAKVKKAISAL